MDPIGKQVTPQGLETRPPPMGRKNKQILLYASFQKTFSVEYYFLVKVLEILNIHYRFFALFPKIHTYATFFDKFLK